MFKSGFISIIGRPNSGKSTLLNQLLGEKVSIVSDKPQTTRENILGILTLKEGQIVFTDTPGIHKPGYELNRRMMQTVYNSLEGTDLLLVLVDASTAFGSGDQYVVDLIKERGLPAFLLLNKIDLIRKDKLLPLMASYAGKHTFAEIVPISALERDNLELLTGLILKYLPEGPAHFPEEQFTDRHERFLAGEIVREKLLLNTREELPYSTTVLITRFDESQPEVVVLNCDIVVEKDSQKKIVIGSQGQKLKQIGIEARTDIETLLGKRVYLELYVRVKPKWRDDPRFLDSLL
ncbi:MAG: GTPase Era [Acidobacteria bacterium]|nr:GTPase Era [Acidobacteriota bacterium]MCI0628200.1 GTPase Era [Acidobacteriota bacterium]MCI0719627.1 GTPase Era [Acidobacteriota bacterium]